MKVSVPNPCRIRRSTDNAEQDFFFTRADQWYEARKWLGDADGYLVRAGDVEQLDFSKQPLIRFVDDDDA